MLPPAQGAFDLDNDASLLMLMNMMPAASLLSSLPLHLSKLQHEGPHPEIL